MSEKSGALIEQNGRPLKVDIQKAKNLKVESTKPKRRDKSDLGENFIPPDGGWGWVVAVGSGLGTLFTYAMMQQYGIIFRERLSSIGINASMMTTIINTQTAVSSCTGLLNGPVFRRFSFRQVAVFGAACIFLGILTTAFANSFLLYMLTIAVFYGIGRGFFVSAAAMAVNTYWRARRRTATSYSWGIAGVGPMFLPYLSTYLLHTYGVQGTVIIFAGISLNVFACAMLFQPVKRHVKEPKEQEMKSMNPEAIDMPSKEDDEEHQVKKDLTTGDPDTPMLARANDGWYGSKISLNSARYYRRSSSVTSIKYPRSRTVSSTKGVLNDLQELKETMNNNHYENIPSPKSRSQSNTKSVKEDLQELKELLEEEANAETKLKEEEHEEHLEEMDKLPWYKKVAIFFDLDLLRDRTYVNLAIGLTVINFVEVNFAVLTPFILSDFGFDSKQIAIAMSVLATLDLVMRFVMPLATSKIKLENKTFYLIGVMGTSLGRIAVGHSKSFELTVAAMAWIGMNKAFRIIFTQLIIPGYVPLKRLPAAAGLQLLITGLFTLAVGPIVGLIRDATNYTVTLHFLNGMCYLAAAAWVIEDLCFKPKKQMDDK
ncbi:hypothetical protein ACFFRR_003334 [Megaselia abdita]